MARLIIRAVSILPGGSGGSIGDTDRAGTEEITGEVFGVVFVFGPGGLLMVLYANSIIIIYFFFLRGDIKGMKQNGITFPAFALLLFQFFFFPLKYVSIR